MDLLLLHELKLSIGAKTKYSIPGFRDYTGSRV
jgi:hypothetical protein